MTDVLADRFREQYPPIKGFERVQIYKAHERIYLMLQDFVFNDAPRIRDSKNILGIAHETFDVHFVFEKRGDTGEAIFFEPNVNDPYHLNHSCHYIKVNLPSSYPEITISTANRGGVELLETQREKYFGFVTRVYDLFVENATS